MTDRQMVQVGCKIPNGLVLHVMERVHYDGRPVEPPRFKDRGLVELVGFARHNQGLAPGQAMRTEYFTPVDKELIDIWLAENAESPIVKNGLVFISKSDEEKAEDARKAAEEQNERLEEGEGSDRHDAEAEHHAEANDVERSDDAERGEAEAREEAGDKALA